MNFALWLWKARSVVRGTPSHVVSPAWALCVATVAFLVPGCQRSFPPRSLLGTWELDAVAYKAKWTYFGDHTWRLSVSGSTNAALAGDWVLDGNRLTTITRQSSLAPGTLSGQETVVLSKLTSSLMEATPKDRKVGEKTYVLRRVEADDAGLTLRLAGTWTDAVANTNNGVSAHMSSTYETEGKATWSATVTGGLDTETIVRTGEWWVEYGYLCAVVTNPAPLSLSALEAVSRDEIVEVTPTQFTFLDSQGTLHTTSRK